jgi:hypothetical protein
LIIKIAKNQQVDKNPEKIKILGFFFEIGQIWLISPQISVLYVKNASPRALLEDH